MSPNICIVQNSILCCICNNCHIKFNFLCNTTHIAIYLRLPLVNIFSDATKYGMHVVGVAGLAFVWRWWWWRTAVKKFQQWLLSIQDHVMWWYVKLRTCIPLVKSYHCMPLPMYVWWIHVSTLMHKALRVSLNKTLRSIFRNCVTKTKYFVIIHELEFQNLQAQHEAINCGSARQY